ncbi:MAG: relaxase, partial [Pseudomonadota bacterium]
MILKGSQRGGGQDLAIHLMRLDDNEHIDIHELRGFVAEDLKGAFK